MARDREVRALLSNLRDSVDGHEGHEYQGEHRPRRSVQELLSGVNLAPYKTHKAWPGRKYLLLGNSYNVDSGIYATNNEARRAACIAVVLERGRDNRNCVSVEDALEYEGFVESLSRFERDWLRRQPASTLIGPAYDDGGNLITGAFAVWRREEASHKRVRELASTAR